MEKYREPQKACFCCGGQIPNDVKREKFGDYYDFRCAKCGVSVLQGIVASNGQPAEVPPPAQRRTQNIILGNETDWRTAEHWWTNTEEVSLIHGRCIRGNEDLVKYINEVKNIYERS